MCGVCDGDGCPYCGCYVSSSTPQPSLHTADQLRQAKVEVLREAADRLMNCGEEFGAKHLLILAEEIEKGEQ